MTESVSEITDVLTVSVGGRRAERLEGNTCVKYLKGYYDNTLCCKQTVLKTLFGYLQTVSVHMMLKEQFEIKTVNCRLTLDLILMRGSCQK